MGDDLGGQDDIELNLDALALAKHVSHGTIAENPECLVV